MYKLLVLGIVLLFGSSVAAQQQAFIGPKDSLRYRVETKVATSGFDPKTNAEMRFDALSTFTVSLSRAQKRGDTLIAATYITNVQTKLDVGDNAPPSFAMRDTVIEGWPYEAIEFHSAFSAEGKLLSMKPAAEDDMDALAAVEKFADLLKLVYFPYDATGINEPGKHSKSIQKDTAEVYGMQVVTWMYADRVWSGEKEINGVKYHEMKFVIDSTSFGGNSFLQNSGISMTPGGTYGTISYLHGTTRPYRMDAVSRSEMDFSALLPTKDTDGSGKNKPPVMIIEMSVRAELMR